MGIDRRRFLLGTIGLGGAGLLAACSGDGEHATDGPATAPSTAPVPRGSPLPPPGSPGLVDEARWQARIDEYLDVVTRDSDLTRFGDVASNLVRAHRDPDYRWDVQSVTAESFAWAWDYFDDLGTPRDFRVLDLLWVLHLADGATPMRTLHPAVVEAADSRMAANRWRYDDPLPVGRVDQQQYWTENHIIILLVTEYLAGQRLADTTFAVAGLTGAEHRDRSKQPVLEWIDERARFGFFEYHSHVYMRLNVTPLLMLVEMADDPEMVDAAAMGLDLCLLDIAAHTHRGTYTAARGRTYKKDKSSATDEPTFTMAKLLFDDAEVDHDPKAEATTAYFCSAQRYRPPQLLLSIATAPGEVLVRERHGVFVDGSAPITDDPPAPFGYDFDDPADLGFWWSMNGLGLWQVADLSLAEGERFSIFDAEDRQSIRLLFELNDWDAERLKVFLRENRAVLDGSFGEADTYHWRNDLVALASVVDHRFGHMQSQAHAWQATIDEEALVYTTHPMTEPAESDRWKDDPSPGYWTGEASMPRSAQHERSAIHIYEPSWNAATIDPVLAALFAYRDYTHAWFPQDAFDEVVRDGGWTFGRKGDGFVALHSWRPTQWREYDPAVHATRGMELPFDLIAPGGPENVWIVEVGDASQAAFRSWVQERLDAPVDVERDSTGFRVEWSSPASGNLQFGSTGPFQVDGEVQPLADFPRHGSPWGTVDRLEKRYELEAGGASLTLDFDAMTRALT